MGSTDDTYQIEASVPVIYQRGVAQVARLGVHREGVEVEPTAATYTLYRGGTAVVDAAAATPGTPTTYDLTVTHLPTTAPLGRDWREEWNVTLPDGTQRLVRRPVALARCQLLGPVTQADLLGEYPDLLANVSGAYATNLQGWITAAWRGTQRMLAQHGDFPYIVVDASQLYDLMLHEVLERYFRALFSAQPGAERYDRLWMSHEEKARAARTGLRITVDRDQDGDPEATVAAGPRQIHLNAPYTADPRRLSSKYR